jgi:hypothetical protein
MPTVNIDITITANGPSISQGVTFVFAPGAGTPSGVLKSDGSLDLSKQYTAGTAVVLAFQLQTTSLKFSSGSYPLTLFGQNGATNACWIALKGQPLGPYSGSQFAFAPNAMGPGNGSLAITDSNNDGNTYQYALFAWLGGTAAQKLEDDPHIINHSTNG